MNMNTTCPTNPQLIGNAAIEALLGMNIPPSPPYYRVWFSHLEKKNQALSSEIEQKIESDNSIDEYFLKDIHERYFELAHPSAKIEKFTNDILNETVSLKELVETFDMYSKEFSDDIADASQFSIDPEDTNSPAAKMLASLVEAAQKAIVRSASLEQNLSEASTKINKLQTSIEAMADDANTDFLTKLNNRRYFDTAVVDLIASAHAQKSPFCMIVADIDHFKKFNDKWGHPVGDQVLKLVADVLRENVKGQDLLARYGGEEFIAALPNTSLRDAAALANNIRAAVAKRKLVNKATNEDLGRVTMSFGVSELEASVSFEELYKTADAALYRAKSEGRNKVVYKSMNETPMIKH